MDYPVRDKISVEKIGIMYLYSTIAGESVSDHFPDVRKLIEAGKGTQHTITNTPLTPYA